MSRSAKDVTEKFSEARIVRIRQSPWKWFRSKAIVLSTKVLKERLPLYCLKFWFPGNFIFFISLIIYTLKFFQGIEQHAKFFCERDSEFHRSEIVSYLYFCFLHFTYCLISGFTASKVDIRNGFSTHGTSMTNGRDPKTIIPKFSMTINFSWFWFSPTENAIWKTWKWVIYVF